MPSIHLDSCCFAHSSAVPVLADVTLDLADTWVGVVGANGAGKSTLLDLVAGTLQPTRGRCTVVADHRPVLCPQSVERLDDAICAFGNDWSGPAARLRSRLTLDPGDLDRWSTLSPGERKRWQIGAVLACEPDVLLLDEPTNHVDGDARDLLLNVLRDFRGLGLVVSHDRGLLDALTTTTVRLAAGRAEVHAGSYSVARPRWVADEEAARETHARARREERRLQQVLADVRRDRQGAERAPRAARRSGLPDDREAGRKFAASKAEQKLANRVHQVRTRVDRAAEATAGIEVATDLHGDITFRSSPGGRWVVRVTGDVRHAGGAVVLHDVDVAVARGEHVWLAGPNGAGKTTLLQELKRAAPAGVGWLPQELTAEEAVAVRQRVQDLDPTLRGRALGILATLGVEPDRVLVSDRPSPGEERKLALALLLLDPARLVLLDEPTNHLDLPSIERLEEAIAGFAGAVVLATHDQALARATTSTTWRIHEGVVVVERT